MGNIISSYQYSELGKLTLADRRLIRSIKFSDIDREHVNQLTGLIAATDANKFRAFLKRFQPESAYDRIEYNRLAPELIRQAKDISSALGSLKVLVETDRVDINKPSVNDGENQSPLLHFAVRYGVGHQGMEIFRFLISRGANPTLVDWDKNAPLYYAMIDSTKLDYIRELAKYVAQSDPPPICMLIEGFADRCEREEEEYPISELIQATQILLDAGADINTVASLVLAIDKLKHASLPDYVTYLIEKGADPNLADEDGDTPLMVAIRKKRETVVAMLLSHHVDVNPINSGGQTTLLLAAEFMPSLVPELLQLGADPTVQVDGKTYLDLLYGELSTTPLEIPSALEEDPLLPKCSICLSVLTEPVIDTCGHTFDRECILKHIEENQSCPVARTKYENPKFAPNYAIREFMEGYIASKKDSLDSTGVTNDATFPSGEAKSVE